ncbi:MAG: alanine racemase [Desulfuromonadales bacterium]
MSADRPTRVEINLAALRHNFRAMQKIAGPDCDILAVVKADAYGHGVPGVAPALAEAGASQFGVALVEEGVVLREIGIEQPILVLGSAFPGQEDAVLRHRLTPVIYDLETACRLERAAAEYGARIAYHLKVDTGMGRLGFRVAQLDDVLAALKGLTHLDMVGLMTHLAVADEPERTFTTVQYQAFHDVVATVTNQGFRPRHRHIANSAGLYSRELAGCNLVRPGIALYGGLTGGPYAHPLRQEPVMHFVSQVAQLKDLQSGEGISYGHRFVTRRPSRIAAIPVGYADGYNRLLSNQGEVLIDGSRAPVVGTVCMDWILVDVTDLSGVRVGDPVTLLGRDGDDCISAAEWAAKVGSITYEVFCLIGKRVPRVFIDPEAHQQLADPDAGVC